MNNLTICIPTYNRAPFLEWTLRRLQTDFPDTSIVVSDNCSTDSTIDVQWMFHGLNNIKQKENIGPFPNMRAALLAAQTKYCVFCGDDDYLLPDVIAKGIEYLEADPTCVAYYAPTQLYDEVQQKIDWEAFYIPDERSYTETDRADVWNLIITRHVWPEHAIYRRDRLEEIILPRTNAYWCFVDLAHAVKRGSVYFSKTPFHRNITAHPAGTRVKLGDVQCLTDFDNYRTGLEILAFELFNGYLTPDKKRTIADMIRQFLWVRYEVANRLLWGQGKEDAARVMQRRMAMNQF